jgi:hypothetical protein
VDLVARSNQVDFSGLAARSAFVTAGRFGAGLGGVYRLLCTGPELLLFVSWRLFWFRVWLLVALRGDPRSAGVRAEALLRGFTPRDVSTFCMRHALNSR